MKKLLLALLLVPSISFSQWCPSCIQNTAVAQNAQMNITSATIRSQLTVLGPIIGPNAFTTASSMTASVFVGSGTYLTDLNASELLFGTLPSAVLTGSYPGISGIGTVTSGTWHGAILGSQYGGTNANLVTSGVGSIPYFSSVGTMSALSPGTATYLLQSNGSAAPSYTNAPQVLGTNITSIPMANLIPGQLPSNITINDASISTVSAAKVIGNIPGKSTNITGNLSLLQLSTGTLINSIVASSITATGVIPGIYGGPQQLFQGTVGSDGRLTSASQTPFTVYAASISVGALPSGVTIGASQVTSGSLSNSVIASSLNVTGVVPGSYGFASQTSSITIRGDGRISFANNVPIAINTSQINNGTLTAGVLVPASNVQAGSLAGNVIASSVAATGVVAGTYGTPTNTLQITIGSDGRVHAITQYLLPDLSSSSVSSNIDNAWTATQTFFSSVTINNQLSVTTFTATTLSGNGSALNNLTPSNISSGYLGLGVIASSINVSGVSSGTYGNSSNVSQIVVGVDGRITSAANIPIPGISTSSAFINVDNKWSATQTFLSSVTISNNMSARNISANGINLVYGISASTASFSGSISAISSMTAGAFFGDGSHLTNVSALCVNGTGSNSVLCSGLGNASGGVRSVVSGGLNNSSSGFESTVSGGESNGASNTYSAVGGGEHNTASGLASSVGGGLFNTASGDGAGVFGGGPSNIASGNSSFIGGGNGNTAGGVTSTIPGGLSNSASGINSFAAGYASNAISDGSFVFGASSRTSVVNSDKVYDNGANTFNIYAKGGIYLSSGAVTVGSTMNVASTVTALAFSGNGSLITNLPAFPGGNVPGATTFQSSITVVANAFSVGGSSFTVSGGSVTAAYQFSAGSFLGVSGATETTTSALTGVGTAANPLGVNSSSVAVLSSGLVLNSQIDASSITKQGNAFNGNNQLVKTNGSGQLPAIDGSLLSNLTAAKISGGVLGGTVIASSVAATGVTSGSYGDATHVSQVTVGVDGRVTSATTVLITGSAPGGTAGGNLAGSYPNPIIGSGVIVATHIANGIITNTQLAAGSFGNITGLGPLTSALSLSALSGNGASVTVSTSMTVNSTMTVLGSAFSIGGSTFTVSGGSATAAYSLTAGSFVGNGANITNYAINADSETAVSQSVASTSNVSISTVSATLRGSRYLKIQSTLTILNSSGAQRTYTLQIFQNGSGIGNLWLHTITNGNDATVTIPAFISSSPSGLNSFSINILSNNATGTQTVTQSSINLTEF